MLSSLREIVNPPQLLTPSCPYSSTMVFCAYCGKSFTRKEHLERHIPSRKHDPPLFSARIELWILTPSFQIPTSSLIGAAVASSLLLGGKKLQNVMAMEQAHTLIVISSRDTILHITRLETPWSLFLEASPPLLDERQSPVRTVPTRRLVVTKESHAHDVRKRTYPARLDLREGHPKRRSGRLRPTWLSNNR